MKKLKTIPPRFFLRFFRWFCHPKLRDSIEGDLMELYEERVREKGKRKADLKFVRDVLLLFRPSIIRPMEGHQNLNNYGMIKSYFTIGWRNLYRNKGFSFINIFGLATGMTACVLIMLYVVDELSYDRHHVDGDRIVRIASKVKDEIYVATSAPIANGLKTDFPEVEQSTRLLRFPGTDKILVKDEITQKQFFEINGYYVDSTFFQIFTFNFKFGDINTALNGPSSIVISEQVANKFFGSENPLDKVLKVTFPFGDYNYTVKGVFKDSFKSHIPANLLFSMNNSDVGGWVKNQTNWATNNMFHTYVKLRKGTNQSHFESKLNDFLNRNGGSDMKAAGFNKTLFTQLLQDIYLHSNFGFEVASNGNIKYLYIFTSVAVFLLLIACINFMNLSTARSERRAKEVGLRKVIGAVRGSLVGQFLTESLLMSGLALLFAFLFIQLFIPVFNQLVNKQLSLLQLPNVHWWLIGLTLATGCLSGLYPAFYLSSFKPAAVMKGKLLNTFSAVAIRKGLVVFQFVISIILILGAVLISRQMKFLSSENLGFDKNQKIILHIQTTESNKNAEILKSKILTNSQVVSATHAATYPGIENISDMLFYAEGKSMNETVDITVASAGDDYLETLGIELLSGRGFSKQFTSDSSAIILNETAIKELGYTTYEAIDKNVYFEWEGKKVSMKVIGVVKDYHFQSLHQKIKPIALTASPYFGYPNSFLIVNLRSGNYADLIAELDKIWHVINPGSPFEYSFLDQDFQRNYEKEERTLALVKYFTIIATVIACLGLFALASFSAEQRVKEVGIRKVLGASIPQLVGLMSKDFLKLVVIAIAIASPLAYYLMDRWLQDFAYHTTVNAWMFVIVGLLALLIAFLTISTQAVKAALTNPVNSLKSE